MTPSPESEFFISVDVETAGPVPSLYSMLAIGACTVSEPKATFYIELKPDQPNTQPESLASHGLSLEMLAKEGIEPAEALRRFQEWIQLVTPPDAAPIFVGFNAAFDWMFVNDYFHRYLGHNPFSHAALDIKSYYMGLTGSTWAKTKMRHVGPRYLDHAELIHHALHDALDQAVLFQKMLAEAKSTKENTHD